MPPPRPTVTLYGRPGCGLCDEAELLLRALAPHHGFDVELVNIETDEGLQRKYLLEIPVVALQGREVARAPIYAAALEEAIDLALREGWDSGKDRV